jgi:prophage regulatory protein
MTSQRLIRLRDVRQRTGLSSSSIYAKISDGLFPRPVKLGPRASAWIEGEVSQWIEAQIERSRKSA